MSWAEFLFLALVVVAVGVPVYVFIRPFIKPMGTPSIKDPARDLNAREQHMRGDE